MKKIFIILFIFFLSINIINSQQIRLKIVEKKGLVDIKTRDGKWTKPELNDVINYGTEIFTGFHSQLSIEIGNNSFVTINQLSHVKIEKVLILKKEATTKLYLTRGYLVALSKPIKSYKNKIFVTMSKGSVEFNDAGGEIYLRKDKGAIIKSFQNKVKIGSKLSKVYAIRKGEVCGITSTGRLIEGDEYLRKNINAIPNDLDQPQEIIAYYDLLFQNYSLEFGSGDYTNNQRP